MTTHTPPLGLDEVAPHLDAVPNAVGPALVLGLDETDTAHWWAPRAVGHLDIISATGAGRTSLARSLVAQLVRQTPIPDTAPRPLGPESIPTVTVVGQAHEWGPLVGADAAAPVHPSDLVLIPDHDLDVAAVVITVLADRVRRPRTEGPDRYRFLVLDDVARLLTNMRETLPPARFDAVRDALRVIGADGPDVGVYTVFTVAAATAVAWPGDVPHDGGARAVAHVPPTQLGRLMPGAQPDVWAPGRWHVDAGDGSGPALVRAPLVGDGPDLGRFLAG